MRPFFPVALLLASLPSSQQGDIFVFPHDPLASMRYAATSTAIEATDWNGDGRVDVLFGDTSIATWVQQPDGTFVPDVQIDTPGDVYAFELVDVEGDGDLDVVAGMRGSCSSFGGATQCTDGQNRLLFNAGNGALVDETLARAPLDDTTATRDVKAGDLDGDGDQDLVWGHITNSFGGVRVGGEDEVWRNEGGGTFVSIQPLHGAVADDTLTVSLLDADLDGDLDLFSNRSLWTNDGAGTFGNPVLLTSATPEPTDSVVPDIDGDGDADLILSFGDSSFMGCRVYRNDAGVFGVISSGLNSVEAKKLRVGDLDGDGDPDLVRSAGSIKPFVNDGSGFFTPAPGVNVSFPPDFCLADIEQDGDIDVLTVTTKVELLVGNGTGAIQRADFTLFDLGFNVLMGPVAVDADGDGDLDIAAGRSLASNTLLENVGGGRFRPILSGNWTNQSTARKALTADFNQDGRSDLLGISSGGGGGSTSRIFLGSPTGFAAGATFFGLPTAPSDALIEDFNEDGAPDIVFAFVFQTPHMYLNQGNATFAEVPGAFPIQFVLGEPMAGDVDGDGRLDMLFSNGVLYLGNGDGTFRNGSVPWSANDAALADFDLDGDLDVALQYPLPNRHGLALNDGRGGFVDATANLNGLGSRSDAVLAEDWDLDGDVDLVFVGFDILFAENEGSGTFVQAGEIIPLNPLAGYGGGAILADFDDDLDPDLLFGGQLGYLINRSRSQLSWRGVPGYGKDIDFEIHGSPNGNWWILFSPFTTRLPLPFGILRLDPIGLELVLQGTFDVDGATIVPIPVPNDPALVGTTFDLQLLLDGPLRLGNYEPLPITAF